MENSNITSLLKSLRMLLIVLDAIILFVIIISFADSTEKPDKLTLSIAVSIVFIIIALVILLLSIKLKKKKAHLQENKEIPEIPALPLIIYSKNFARTYTFFIYFLIFATLGSIALSIFKHPGFLFLVAGLIVYNYFLYREKLKMDTKYEFNQNEISVVNKLKAKTYKTSDFVNIEMKDNTVIIKNGPPVFYKTIEIFLRNDKLVIDGRRLNFPVDKLFNALKKNYF